MLPEVEWLSVSTIGSTPPKDFSPAELKDDLRRVLKSLVRWRMSTRPKGLYIESC